MDKLMVRWTPVCVRLLLLLLLITTTTTSTTITGSTIPGHGQRFIIATLAPDRAPRDPRTKQLRGGGGGGGGLL